MSTASHAREHPRFARSARPLPRGGSPGARRFAAALAPLALALGLFSAPSAAAAQAPDPATVRADYGASSSAWTLSIADSGAREHVARECAAPCEVALAPGTYEVTGSGLHQRIRIDAGDVLTLAIDTHRRDDGVLFHFMSSVLGGITGVAAGMILASAQPRFADAGIAIGVASISLGVLSALMSVTVVFGEGEPRVTLTPV